MSCAEYRHRFADRRHRLSHLLPDADALPDDHRGNGRGDLVVVGDGLDKAVDADGGGEGDHPVGGESVEGVGGFRS
jgi:hypothetical protein